jgi:hypothetical protein
LLVFNHNEKSVNAVILGWIVTPADHSLQNHNRLWKQLLVFACLPHWKNFSSHALTDNHIVFFSQRIANTEHIALSQPKVVKRTADIADR